MPTSARTSLEFFGQFADVGIRALEQHGPSQQPLVSSRPATRNRKGCAGIYFARFKHTN